MMDNVFHSFEDFWPHYVRQHANPTTRRVHFVATSAAMACVATAILLKRPKLLLLAAAVGYGPAWVSHFVVEGNRPATWKYPLWSLRADLLMWSKMLHGEMDAEVLAATQSANPCVNTASNGVHHADA